MVCFSRLIMFSGEEELEVIEEVAEEISEYNLDDIYRVLSACSDELGDISGQLDALQETGEKLLQLLQSSFLDSIAALLLILVGFEIMRLVRGWTKGERFIGRNS